MKNNRVVKNLNPYFKNEKWSKYRKDTLVNSIKFVAGENITLNYAWAIKGISKLIRLYVKHKLLNRTFITNADFIL